MITSIEHRAARLHRRCIITQKVEIVDDATVVEFANDDCAVVIFNDEPNRRRYYARGDGSKTVSTSNRYDFWVGVPS